MKRILLILLVMLACGCGSRQLVEVKIVSVWTQEDYGNAKGSSCFYPHTTVERQDTLERIRIRGSTYGKVGDTFMLRDKDICWDGP